jgi:hypothetical protein
MSIDSSKVEIGDRIWTVNHYKVKAIENGWYVLSPDDGKANIRAQAGVLEGAFHSVSKFTTTEKVSTTAMVEKIKQAGHGDFRVTFHKKIDDGNFAEKVQTAVADDTFGDNPRKRKKWMKENHKGEKRVMKARLLRNTDTNKVAREEAGRIPVYDLDNEGKRLIDERTIVELITEGVKYEKK